MVNEDFHKERTATITLYCLLYGQYFVILHYIKFSTINMFCFRRLAFTKRACYTALKPDGAETHRAEIRRSTLRLWSAYKKEHEYTSSERNAKLTIRK